MQAANKPIYFDTTEATSADLERYKIKASSQSAKIYDLFKQFPDSLFSPSDVWSALFDDGTPITSVRRSMTVLTGHGLLTKTGTQVDGIYGRPEFCWKLTGDAPCQLTTFN